MIEIDDAGGGCFLGPEVMVIHKLETGQAKYLLIPPQVTDRILCATKLLRNAFLDLGISRTEPVKLCRGEIFDLFETYLAQKGYQVVREKVSDSTDNLAESKFMEILHSYGFPNDLCLENRNYQEFYELVSFWYHTLPEEMGHRIRKARLHPPYRARNFARKYPNLLRQIFTEDAV
jgi:hypothetical protein